MKEQSKQHNQSVTFSEKETYWLLNLVILLGWLILCAYNYTQSPYGDNAFLYNHHIWIKLTSPVCLFLLLKLIVKNFSLPSSFTDPFEIILKLSIAFYLIYMCVPIILTTPNKLVDSSLFQFDQMLHVNIFKMMTAISQHQTWVYILDLCYRKWVLAAQLALVYICICNNKKFALHVIRLVQIGAIITSFIFYFFPSLGPAALDHNFWLSKPSYCHLLLNCNTALNLPEYLRIQHHHINSITLFHSGFVSFPSFHFYSSLLVVYMCAKKIKWLLMPAAVFTVLLGAATLFLGHHYLADLIGAVMLFIVSFFIDKKLMNILKDIRVPTFTVKNVFSIPFK